jgi:uncharacterized protein (DUF952 family)
LFYSSPSYWLGKSIFRDKQDLAILSIDPDRVKAEIRYEGVHPNNLFPHIYGELNIDAVLQVTDLESPRDGSFVVEVHRGSKKQRNLIG